MVEWSIHGTAENWRNAGPARGRTLSFAGAIIPNGLWVTTRRCVLTIPISRMWIALSCTDDLGWREGHPKKNAWPAVHYNHYLRAISGTPLNKEHRCEY